jgi:hypothetical protein
MSRKVITGFAVYTLLIVAVTATITAQVATPTAAEAIAKFETQFRADPQKHMSEMDDIFGAYALLEGAQFEFQFKKGLAEGMKLLDDNSEFLDSTHALLADIRKLDRELECDACGGTAKTSKCGCLDGCDCCTKQLTIPDEVGPQIIEVNYDANFVPLAPKLN